MEIKGANLLNRLKIINFNLINNKNVDQIIKNGQFNEIYNLGAQSSVNESFINPIYTSNVNALGTIRILEAIKTLSKKLVLPSVDVRNVW